MVRLPAEVAVSRAPASQTGTAGALFFFLWNAPLSSSVMMSPSPVHQEARR